MGLHMIIPRRTSMLGLLPVSLLVFLLVSLMAQPMLACSSSDDAFQLEMLERKKIATDMLKTHIGVLFLNSVDVRVESKKFEIDLSKYDLNGIGSRKFYKIGVANLAVAEVSMTLSAWLIFAENDFFSSLHESLNNFNAWRTYKKGYSNALTLEVETAVNKHLDTVFDNAGYLNGFILLSQIDGLFNIDGIIMDACILHNMNSDQVIILCLAQQNF